MLQVGNEGMAQVVRPMLVVNRGMVVRKPYGIWLARSVCSWNGGYVWGTRCGGNNQKAAGHNSGASAAAVPEGGGKP